MRRTTSERKRLHHQHPADGEKGRHISAASKDVNELTVREMIHETVSEFYIAVKTNAADFGRLAQEDESHTVHGEDD